MSSEASIQAFGRFLLAKQRDPGTIGELAQAAARDPKFPRDGSPEQVSKLLNQHQAPPELHEALEDAVTEWRAACH